MSWAATAANRSSSSLARLRSVTACSSASCERLRSVRSRVTLANPASRPSSSRTAVIVTLAQKRLPSLRIRQPSSS